MSAEENGVAYTLEEAIKKYFPSGHQLFDLIAKCMIDWRYYNLIPEETRKWFGD
jgi:hypothetical protein